MPLGESAPYLPPRPNPPLHLTALEAMSGEFEPRAQVHPLNKGRGTQTGFSHPIG